MKRLGFEEEENELFKNKYFANLIEDVGRGKVICL